MRAAWRQYRRVQRRKGRLAADTMRRHDPAQAPDVIATHLGHATTAAGAAYRAICDGEAAAKDWARDRARLPETGGVVSMKTG